MTERIFTHYGFYSKLPEDFVVKLKDTCLYSDILIPYLKRPHVCKKKSVTKDESNLSNKPKINPFHHRNEKIYPIPCAHFSQKENHKDSQKSLEDIFGTQVEMFFIFNYTIRNY